LHDRGCWFTLDEGSPRSLSPGRRPFHTLIANMLLRNGRPWVVYGSMGGDGQPQTGLALSIRIAERGMDPQAAIEAPRWRWFGNASADEPDLFIEARVGEACIAGLRARGHRVEVCDDWEETMGHAGAIVIDREEGILLGGSDPRSDGLALGG
jgi:gamma-glutamyltranspeptidase/glutathione hydrolase